MICSVRGLMPIVEESLQRGQHVRLAATGDSMWPFLRDGDMVELAPVEAFPDLGAILLARVEPDCYVLHRLSSVDGELLYLLGDAHAEPEGPLTLDCLVGEVVGVQKGQRWRALNTGTWHFLGRLWLSLLPIRKQALSLFRLVSRLRRKLIGQGPRP